MTRTATATVTTTQIISPVQTINKNSYQNAASKSQCPTDLNNRTEKHSEFTWSYTDEPHVSRRRAILAKHPEIAELFGVEPKTLPIVALIAITQICVSYYLRDSSWWVIFIVGWALGGTLNHSLQLANHELSHNLCFNTPVFNRFLGMGANLVTGFPSSVSFQKYHMDHHQYQGHEGIDTDIPTVLETQIFQGPLMKCLWIIMQPIFYALRPTIVKPKPYGRWELLNTAIQLTFNYLIAHYFGMKSFSYLIIGTILGLGLHPAAGHFIAEHYEFMLGQETYSYYGLANYVNFNVGYHNEHHDFPKIPWSRLPLVTKIAPEFYLTLPHYNSYWKVFMHYINDKRVGPFARIKRLNKNDTNENGHSINKTSTKTKYFGYLFAFLALSWFCACIGYVVVNSMKQS